MGIVESWRLAGSVCCKEVSRIMDKVGELEDTSHVGCITEHPRFATVCLDIWVLQTVPSALWGWIYYTTDKRVRLGKV